MAELALFHQIVRYFGAIRVPDMNHLIEALREEHANHEALLRTFESQFDVAKGADLDVVEAIVEYFLTYPIIRHHPLESLIFAKVLLRDPDSADKIGDLDREHADQQAWLRAFAAALTTMRAGGIVRSDTLTNTAGTFIQKQRAHIVAEEDQFFPAAIKALLWQDWMEIERNAPTDVADNPIFGSDTGGRSVLLRRWILRCAEEVKPHMAIQ